LRFADELLFSRWSFRFRHYEFYVFRVIKIEELSNYALLDVYVACLSGEYTCL
jgi:hypothetical protein